MNKNGLTDYKFNLRGLCSKKVTIFVSLLFIVVLVFSPFVSAFSGVSFFALGVEASNIVVKTEGELGKAVKAAPDDKTPYVIGFSDNIVLKKSLEIPVDKNIVLVSVGGVWKLVGPNKQCTVKVNGLLTIDGIIVTHVIGKSGSGVYVSKDGVFTLLSGAISGNTAGVDGGGVYNEGVFEMYGGEINSNVAADWGGGVCNYFGIFTLLDGKISNNKAAAGGGVFNDGNFSMLGGEIIGNTAIAGGGVNNSGNFYRHGGVISDNTVSDVDEVYIDRWIEMGGTAYGWLIVFIIVTAVIVGFAGVVILLFYHSKRQKNRCSPK